MCSCSFENLDSVEINNTTHSYIRNLANQLIYSSNFGSVSTRKVVACAPLPFYRLASFFNTLFTSQVATAPIFVLEVVSWLKYIWRRQGLVLKRLLLMKLNLPPSMFHILSNAGNLHKLLLLAGVHGFVC